MTTNRPSMSTTGRGGRPRVVLVLGVLSVAALVLAACGSDDETDGGAPATVEVRDAWARTSASGQAMGVAYMVLVGGQEDDRLVGASVSPDVAALTELHETLMAGDSDAVTDVYGEMDMPSDGEMDRDPMAGMMTMREVPAIDVPAGGEVALEPGGYHVMLLDLAAPLVEGETVDLTLDFEQAGTVTVTAEVRDA